MSDTSTDSEDEGYVLVDNNEVAPIDISVQDTMNQILYWIGFRTEAQRTSLIEDAFESFDDFKSLTEKDISTMSSDFSSRTVANGKITFGTRRSKQLKALVHWVHDFYRVSGNPTIVGLSTGVFRLQLDRALARAEIRKSMILQSKTSATAATPGPLENEKQWKPWEEKFCNYARSHIGSNGIPLSYVIRENEVPDIEGMHPDFVSQTISCAPLTGEYYSADRRTVFNMIVSFTTGQPSRDWIKNTLRYSDGRRSMIALRTHFAGEGNASRNMAEAERMHESIHYRGERALSFETFLTQCQKMFNIFEKEGEEMSDEAKVRFLFRKVQHAGLRSSIDALKASQTTGTELTYTMAANHLSTAVSELPEYIAKNARNVSGIHQGDGGGKGDIYNKDGTINTGHIPTWKTLPFKDRKIVNDERRRLGIKYNDKGKGNAGKGGGPRNKNAANTNRMKQLEDQNLKYKRQIKAMKRVNHDDEGSTETETDIDAGDQFGGKASRKKKVRIQDA